MPASVDRLFTTHTGEPAITLYKNMIEDLLTEASLWLGPSGIPRSTYSFRHTYATFRLSEGIDSYFLAQQMGTSVKMIASVCLATERDAARVAAQSGDRSSRNDSADPNQACRAKRLSHRSHLTPARFYKGIYDILLRV
jgi:integrase